MSFLGQLASCSQFSVIIMIPAIIYTLLLTLPSTLASAYVFKPNMISINPAQQQYPHASSSQYLQRQPTSALASKVVFHSPSLANIYKEMIVSSKPLLLRKHGNGSKAKKTKKDSKIYYIPIPAMPYRYIPGVGLDYQPMKIKPILQEAPLGPGGMGSLNEIAHVSSNGNVNQNTNTLSGNVAYGGVGNALKNEFNLSGSKKLAEILSGESKMNRMHRGNYYFNGRPFRLQVAHAQPKNQLTPLNFKSKLYFNKNIIY
ncbi:uncharacterized protein [Eurosta solidaginis]